MGRATIIRPTLRSSVTRLCNQINNLLNVDDEVDLVSVQNKVQLLTKRFNELQDVDKEILEGLVIESSEQGKSQEDINSILEVEIMDSDEYILNYNDVLNKVKNLEMNESRSNHPINMQIDSERKRVKKIRYPKLELKKFNGELSEWLPFWAQFEKIHKDEDFEDADKFQYLIHCTVDGSKPREIVESFPATGENYQKAIEALKTRYGDRDLLVDVYIRELLKLILHNMNNEHKDRHLASLYDKLECQIRALETLGIAKGDCAAILMPMILSALPIEVLRVWQRKYNEYNQTTVEDKYKARLDELMKFLKGEVENELKLNLARAGLGMNSNVNNSKRHSSRSEEKPTAAALLMESKPQYCCIFCESNHKSSNCKKNMSVEERRKIMKMKRGCYVCLKLNHFAAMCRERTKCQNCRRRHHTMLCDSEKDLEQKRLNENVKKGETKTSEQLASVEKSDKILLQTLVVKIHGSGVTRSVRAIIDTGAQRSHILNNLASDMGYEVVKTEKMQYSLFGGRTTEVQDREQYRIHLSNVNEDYSCNFLALNQEKICGEISPISPGSWVEELTKENISLTDYRNTPIEILIGADVAGKLLTGKKHTLKSGLVAIETKLGWTLMGRVPGEKSIGLLSTSMLANEASVQDLWTLDSLGITEPCEKKRAEELNKEAYQHFLNSVTRTSERYVASLPWLDCHPALPSNFEAVERRLVHLNKKLAREGYLEHYQSVFEEWMREGIIEQVPDSDMNNICHYLPHRPVIKVTGTTKVRPVFDASAREGKHPSLNDCVVKGPNLIETISCVLAKFRLGKVGVISDIAKAFLQIELKREDRDFLRFLWRDVNTGKLIHFRHCRVVFGVACSPFLLSAVIRLHLDKAYEVKGDEDFLKLSNSFYVDNCVSSFNTDEHASTFIEKAVMVMREGGFELRDWERSNEDGTSNVLGLLWNKRNDTLSIDNSNSEKVLSDTTIITKRLILSMTHRLFDPIGITCCVTLLPKILLQKIWSLKLGWDQEVPDEIAETFRKWLKTLNCIEEIKIPRWLGIEDNQQQSKTLQVFCDASLCGYAAVVFMRIESEERVIVRLLRAKARVTPISKNKPKISMPRLELLAANIGARLQRSVTADLGVEDIPTTFWTDSTTVLAWIERRDNWDTFVDNRVKEIIGLTEKNSCWKYVPGEENPADLPSRGCSAKKLLESKWWEGPLWLRLPKTEWPTAVASYNEEEIAMEKRRCIVAMPAMENDRGWYHTRFANFSSMVRMIAWIKRFVFNSRKGVARVQSEELTLDEILLAEKNLWKMVQRESFTGVDDKNIRALFPFKDNEDILRVRTAVAQGEDEEDFRLPILIPGNHPAVVKLILCRHKELCHMGVQGLLCNLREKYWVVGGRRSVKKVIGGCVVCRRYGGKAIQIESPPLMINRIKDTAAFEITGVDVAGPLFLKEGSKVWICLYTCAVYRAVHVELVTSLSTDCFLQSLRRFVARRGRPRIIYSDNGRNFVGAANLFRNLDWKEIERYSSSKLMRWIFNPPSAAWWGGWWERIIGLLKNLLKRIIGRAKLNYEELSTVLCDCEAVLNSRPLTYVSENPKDLIPLTPNTFLHDLRSNGVPDCDAAGADALNRREKYRRMLSQQLRRRFRSEYLGLLTRQYKGKNSEPISVGEVVLIGSDDKRRLDWPLAIVEEVLTGKDGKARVFRLSTAGGQVLRPAQRLFPLEVRVAESEHLKKSGDEEVEPAESERNQEEDLIEIFKTTRSGRAVKIPSRFLD